jgi:hypothetical protein
MARIYRLQSTNPTYDGALRLLRRAAANGKPVRVEFVDVDGEIIRVVRADK